MPVEVKGSKYGRSTDSRYVPTKDSLPKLLIQCLYCVSQFYTQKGLKWHLINYHKITNLSNNKIKTPSTKIKTPRTERNKRYYLKHKDILRRKKEFKEWETRLAQKKTFIIDGNGVSPIGAKS